MCPNLKMAVSESPFFFGNFLWSNIYSENMLITFLSDKYKKNVYFKKKIIILKFKIFKNNFFYLTNKVRAGSSPHQCHIHNKPGVARAVLQTYLWFVNKLPIYLILFFQVIKKLSLTNHKS